MEKKYILTILSLLFTIIAAYSVDNTAAIEVSFDVLGQIEKKVVPDTNGKISAYTPTKRVHNKEFVGWSSSTIPSPTDQCPDTVDIANTVFTQSVTLYAVFAYPNGGKLGSKEVIYTEDFEGYAAKLSYKGQRLVTNAKNGLQWSFNDGNVSTTGAINGTQSAVLQENGNTSYDASCSVTTGKLRDVASVQWKAKLYKSNDVQMNVLYSQDSATWIPLEYKGYLLSKTAYPYSVVLPDVGDLYLRIYAAYNKYTYSSQHKLILDDFVITAKERNYFYTDYSTSDVTTAQIPALTFDENGAYKAIDTLFGENRWITLPQPQRGNIVFLGWKATNVTGCTDTFPANSRYLLNHNVTLQALWAVESSGEKVDIIDWSHDAITINLNGTTASNVSCNGTPLTEGRYLNDSKADDGTYRIPIDTLQMGHDVRLDIQWESYIAEETANKRDTSIHYYRVPYMYDSPQATVGDTLTHYDDVVIRSGKAVVASDIHVHNIYIYPDAELIINPGVSLTCDTLYVRNRAFHTARINVQGNCQAAQIYYTYTTTTQGIYPFAIPSHSSISDTRLTTGKSPVYQQDWKVTTLTTLPQNTWQETTDSLRPYYGYMFHALADGYCEYTFPVKEFAGTPLHIPVYATEVEEEKDAIHTGWNYIASPLMYNHVPVPYEPVEDKIKVSELREDNTTYWQHILTDITPNMPFYYQTREDGYLLIDSHLYFVPTSSILSVSSADDTHSDTTQWIQLTITAPNGLADETSIYLHPDKFCTDYETGYDLPKIKSYAHYPMLYTITNGNPLSFNALPDSVALHPIQLGYYAPEDTTLTVSVVPTDCLHRLRHIYLYDTLTNATTDLLEADYSFRTSAGENQKRLTISCVYQTTETATHTFQHANTTSTACKYLHNGHLYIRQNNAIYDSLGRLLFYTNSKSY